MPSAMLHEALVHLFRERPTLAAELLAATGTRLPAYASVRVREADLGQLRPTQHRADLTLVLVDAAERPKLGLVVEVQTQIRADKRWVWPLYVAAFHARIRAPVTLIVVAPSPSVARWARQPIASFQHGVGFAPLVLGPDAIPWIADEEVALVAPELGLLSALAHGNEDGGVAVALAAIGAARRLDDERTTLYHDVIHRVLNEATRKALEKQMQLKGYEWSDFAKKHRAEGEALGRAKGREEGRVEGREEGRVEGRAKGRVEGRDEGRARGQALGLGRALLRILSTRGLRVTKAQERRILTCEDVATLERWLDGALAAESVARLIE